MKFSGSSLDLQDYFITDLHVSPIPGFHVNEAIRPKPEELVVSTGWGKELENRHWCALIVETKSSTTTSPTLPIVFRISLIGWFNVDPQMKQEAASVNALSVLYSAAREILIGITERTPYPAVFLPTLQFYPTIEPVQTLIDLPDAKEETTSASPSV